MTEQTTSGVDEQAARRGEARLLEINDPWQFIYGEPVKAADEVLERAHRQYAEVCVDLAARLFHQLLPDAHTVVFDKDVDDQGTRISLVTIRDAAGLLIWHEEGPYATFASHPDAVKFAELVAYGERRYVEFEECDTLPAIRSLLRDACNSAPGFFETTDEPDDDGSMYPGDLLKLVIPELLTAQGAGPAPEPLVEVDVALLRGWLSLPEVAYEYSVDSGWEPTAENVAELVQGICDDGDPAGAGWVLHPSVKAVFTSTLRGGDVVFGADMKNGARIASIPQDDKNLRDSRGRTGVDAAVEALVYAAQLIDQAHGR